MSLLVIVLVLSLVGMLATVRALRHDGIGAPEPPLPGEQTARLP